jgi:GT2 family glycosyltransferase
MSQTTPPFVAIIVLTWNQRDLTLDCLASLAAMDYAVDRLHIIVVDNGSKDSTATAVRESFPQVTVLENSNNLGFAEGNNVGIRRALEANPDYIMLLNNDTTVEPDMLQQLLRVIEPDSTVGIVGPKMLYFDRFDTIWCAGSMINWNTGETVRLQAEQPDQSAADAVRPVDFITACAILLRREVIDRIGLLDPRFFIYYEETDWCARASEAGWRILYVPRARLYHKVSAAMGTTSPATDYYMVRNSFLFLSKHRTGLKRLTTLVKTGYRHSLAIAAFTVKSHNGRRLRNRDAKLLGMRDALLGRWGKMHADVAAICSKRP